MRHRIVVREESLTARREQRDEDRCDAMISAASQSVFPEVERTIGWPTAGLDCLLSLAAAPIFAMMALLTGIQDSGMPAMLCSAPHDASPWTGMVPMYLLMSAFHSAPWLRLAKKGLQGLIGVP
jgi:cobalamin biosynthesis protein CobD/CbiB